MMSALAPSCYPEVDVTEQLQTIVEESYRELRPRAPMPLFQLQFYPFANISNTIRLREGVLKIRLSDLLESAPELVLRAILHILLAKIYRRPIDPLRAARYRRFIGRPEMVRQAQKLRQIRGRKKLSPPRGRCYDLDSIFDYLNERYFYNMLGKPRLAWSQEKARNLLGHFDPAHNAIVISRIFDQTHIPRYAIEYLLYHEMLHLRHPVTMRGSRRVVHSAAFNADEKAFPDYEQARIFLKRFL